ncbi:hypothetical protein BH11PSE3_BH11PSE3_23910 [soil metagenome]
MGGRGLTAAIAVIFSLGSISPCVAVGGVTQPDDIQEATRAAERLLGSADETTQALSSLPFSRQLSASGVVTGSLADSTAIAGVPAATMIEALRALANVIDLDRDLRPGDRFHVNYEQAYNGDDQPIGVGRVLWLEVRSKVKGVVAIHRFRPRDGEEQFWLPSGQAATAPPIRLPIDKAPVSSGFGMRADPLDHPTPPPSASLTVAAAPVVEVPTVVAGPPEPSAQEVREVNRVRAGIGGSQLGSAREAFGGGGGSDVDRIMASRRVRAAEARQAELEAAATAAAKAAQPPAAEPAVPPPAAAPAPRRLCMHVGVDLVAPGGAPVYAAADGMVIGAGPNGGYGNWIRINHPDKLTTVYGHLSGFAPGIEAGSMVARGELIGFVGSTGRSTGAHLHFEVLAEGKWVNPIGSPSTMCGQLSGPDLARLRKQVAASLKERDRAATFAVLPTAGDAPFSGFSTFSANR